MLLLQDHPLVLFHLQAPDLLLAGGCFALGLRTTFQLTRDVSSCGVAGLYVGGRAGLTVLVGTVSPAPALLGARANSACATQAQPNGSSGSTCDVYSLHWRESTSVPCMLLYQARAGCVAAGAAGEAPGGLAGLYCSNVLELGAAADVSDAAAAPAKSWACSLSVCSCTSNTLLKVASHVAHLSSTPLSLLLS